MVLTGDHDDETMSDELTDFGFKKIPTAEKARRVAGVFHSVASQYDVMNDVMSLGTHRLMKRFAVEMAAVRPGNDVLDLAGGTGDLAALLSPLVKSNGRIILCDINPSMLEVGRDRLIDRGLVSNIDYVQGDAENLPFPDQYFDAITIGFGLRNVTNKSIALVEMHRVLKPDGRVVILEFSRPQHALTRSVYDTFSGLWPHIGQAITGDADSYQYLVESIRVHPSQEALRQMMIDAGFVDCVYHNLVDGIAAIHTGHRN